MSSILLSIVIACGIGSWIYSCLFLVLGVENLRFWKQHQRSPVPFAKTYARTCVMIPCKGNENGLRENLQAFMEQDHPNFEIRFVVESATDPALKVILQVIEDNPFTDAHVIEAGRASESGQKVHNLCKAVDSLHPGIDVYVFADSDASPRNTWLRWLVNCVGRNGVGARTGYRWMMPERNNVPTLLVCTINNALAAMLGRGKHHLVWGGSWVVHRRVFIAAGIREAWNSVVSDDLAASRALQLTNLEIEFEPQAVCASYVSFSWSSMFEFLRRQLLIARRYTPGYWTSALLVSVMTQIGFWGGLVGGLLAVNNGHAWGWAVLGSAVGLYVTGVLRSIVRQRIGRTAQPAWRKQRVARTFDMLAGPFAGVITLAMMLASTVGNRIVWRGVGYYIASGGRVLHVGRRVDPNAWPFNKRNQPVPTQPNGLDVSGQSGQTLPLTHEDAA